jgi:hypothetical protein
VAKVAVHHLKEKARLSGGPPHDVQVPFKGRRAVYRCCQS